MTSANPANDLDPPASRATASGLSAGRRAEPEAAFVDAPVDAADDSYAAAAAPEVSPESYTRSFGENLVETLDLSSWRAGRDLDEDYARLERLIGDAVTDETDVYERIRDVVFPKLGEQVGAPPGAGVHRAELRVIERVHRGLLFNGGVEACDGTHSAHDTLPLTVHQIGVSLVSYRGNEGTWFQRLFRRDLRQRGGDAVDEVLELLQRRDGRAALNHDDERDALGRLASQAVMAYAERAVLLRRSEAAWRMGHGHPCPWPLITGAGSVDLMVESTKLLRELIADHQKFVFVASEPKDRALLTIGQALEPMQYAIVDTIHPRLRKTIEEGHYGGKATVDMTWDGESIPDPHRWIRRFLDEVGPQVIVGVYRASAAAPAHVFYAHRDHAHLAAHIAIADSLLQDHRGFPLLIDLADHVCRAVFGSRALDAVAGTAYAHAGEPFRFFSERSSRR